MVDTKLLHSKMVLNGYTQRSLAAKMTERGFRMTENTLSAKMKGRSKFDCEDADAICDILGITDAVSKAQIFLA